MPISLESVVIGVLVLGAVAWGIRGAWRSATGGGGCAGCAASGSCSLKSDPDARQPSSPQFGAPSCADLIELVDKEKKPVQP